MIPFSYRQSRHPLPSVAFILLHQLQTLSDRLRVAVQDVESERQRFPPKWQCRSFGVTIAKIFIAKILISEKLLVVAQVIHICCIFLVVVSQHSLVLYLLVSGLIVIDPCLLLRLLLQAASAREQSPLHEALQEHQSSDAGYNYQQFYRVSIDEPAKPLVTGRLGRCLRLAVVVANQVVACSLGTAFVMFPHFEQILFVLDK